MSCEITDQLYGQLDELYNPKNTINRMTGIDQFNIMSGPNVYQVVPPGAVDVIRQFILDPMHNKTTEKIEFIDYVLAKYGFKRFACGTNRAVYRYYEDQSFCLKVSIDRTGLTNNTDEFKNQEYLKPFVSKVFSVSNCGTIATCERVIPIRNREEFLVAAENIFDVIVNRFIGKYLLEDIGTEYFKNWGLRKGFGPVLLDYPYIYEIDINNLYCNDTSNGIPCGGPIDYDDGFNYLYCKKCGKRHMAKQIGKSLAKQLVRLKGEYNMKCIVTLEGRTFETEDRPNIDKSVKYDKSKETKPIPNRPGKFKFIVKVNGIKYGITQDGEYIELGKNGTTPKEAKHRPQMSSPMPMIRNHGHKENTHPEIDEAFSLGIKMNEEGEINKSSFINDTTTPIQVEAKISSSCELIEKTQSAEETKSVSEEKTKEYYDTSEMKTMSNEEIDKACEQAESALSFLKDIPREEDNSDTEETESENESVDTEPEEEQSSEDTNDDVNSSGWEDEVRAYGLSIDDFDRPSKLPSSDREDNRESEPEEESSEDQVEDTPKKDGTSNIQDY